MEMPTIEYYLAMKRGERSEREKLLNDLYSLYDTMQEAQLRKMENIRRYKLWLKERRVKNTKENQEAFMRSRSFCRKIPKSRFWYFVSHIPTKDLYYILSVSRGKFHRGESIGAFIFSLVKHEKSNNH
jgi:hypothetical protein